MYGEYLSILGCETPRRFSVVVWLCSNGVAEIERGVWHAICSTDFDLGLGINHKNNCNPVRRRCSNRRTVCAVIVRVVLLAGHPHCRACLQSRASACVLKKLN